MCLSFDLVYIYICNNVAYSKLVRFNLAYIVRWYGNIYLLHSLPKYSHVYAIDPELRLYYLFWSNKFNGVLPNIYLIHRHEQNLFNYWPSDQTLLQYCFKPNVSLIMVIRVNRGIYRR